MAFMKEWLSSEVMKSNVWSEQVRLRMDKTLSERRKYTVEVKPRVAIIQQEWPWLFRDTEVNTICSNLLCYKLLFIVCSSLMEKVCGFGKFKAL